MLSFFRYLINSRIGQVVTLSALVLIGLAFALGDVTGLRGSGSSGAANGDMIAKVGKFSITPDDLRRRVEGEMQGYAQQRPGLTMAQFVAGGGFDATLERYIDNIALHQFGAAHGIVVSKQSIDGQIASIPQFKGPDGKFSPKLFDSFLASQRLTVEQFRNEEARVNVDQQLTAPTLGAKQVPTKMALPYASQLLERRTGLIGFVPASAIAKGTPPSDQEIAAYYRANITRYVVPERRQIRYAIASADTLRAQATPGAADIAAAYKAKANVFAARETRSVSQVVLGDKGAADALIAKTKQGTAIEAAALAAGLEAAKLSNLDKSAYAAQTSPEAANAVFTAPRGGVVGPIKAPLGWMVVKIDGVEQVAAKSLAQATPELTKDLTDASLASKLLDIRQKIDAALNNNARFDEIVARLPLAQATTPPVFADGRDPAMPEATPDTKFAQIVSAGFSAQQGDVPQLVPVGKDGSFALVGLDRIIAAAPAPINSARAKIAADIVADRTAAAARKIAADIVLKVNGGTPLDKALAGAGVKLPAAKPIDASRAQLAAAGERVPPPLALLFNIQAKSARLLAAPDGQGWFIIALNTIVPGNATNQPAVILGMRRDLGNTLGNEYVQQLAQAARREIGVSKNNIAIAKLRAQLLGVVSDTTQP